MNQILFYMKQERHRADCVSFMRKLKARGIPCHMCKETGKNEKNGADVPADPSEPSFALSARRILVITDDAEAAGLCELQKIACVGYCPAEGKESAEVKTAEEAAETKESAEAQETEAAAEAKEMEAAAEAKETEAAKETSAETAGREEGAASGYFPHVRMVWESFEEREPEELEQFCCRFYGDPVVIARTERLLIRESVPEDLEAVYQLESAPEFCGESREKQEKTGFCISEEDSEKEKFCSYIKNVYPFYGYGYWTVERMESGRQKTVIGRCGLKDYEAGEDNGYVVLRKDAVREHLPGSAEEPFCLELGYAVAEDYRRQGFAYEMCRAVLDYAFAVLHSDTVLVRIHPQNTASLGLARKLGFGRITP